MPKDLDEHEYAVAPRAPLPYPKDLPPTPPPSPKTSRLDYAPKPKAEREDARLTGLLEAISGPAPGVPKIGIEAADSMNHIYETVAKDLEALAQEAVDHANTLRDQISAFADDIRSRGGVLCDAIRFEAQRNTHLMEVLKAAREKLGGVPSVSHETKHQG